MFYSHYCWTIIEVELTLGKIYTMRIRGNKFRLGNDGYSQDFLSLPSTEKYLRSRNLLAVSWDYSRYYVDCFELFNEVKDTLNLVL